MEILTLIILGLVQFVAAQTDDVTVSTVYGDVIGQGIPVASGKVINSFLGVPYAKPPVGDLRFTNPQEPEPWNEPFYATDLGDACIQSNRSFIPLTHKGWERFSEDCLHLNIYVPAKEDPDLLLPVMVWFHGGAFQDGSNFMYPGYFVAERDVAVVTVNYRLGIMGFAYSGDGVVPGNMGLSDQILALKFMQENIAAFGGDPNSVTIFGESAGAASVGHHMMSPLSSGLFHGAILQSGSEMAFWSLHRPEEKPENYFRQVADQFNCTTTDTTEMVECLRLIDAVALNYARFECTVGYECGGFLPVVDGELMPDYPINIRHSGEYNQVPEMIGCTEEEGSLLILGTGPRVNRSEFDENIWDMVSVWAPSWPEPSRDEDIFKAVQFYYADWPYFDDSERNREMYVKMETDVHFGFSSDWQAKLQSANGLPVYYYTYDYIPEISPLPDWMGAYHAIDLVATFGWPYMTLDDNELAFNHSQCNPAANITFTDRDRDFADFFLTLWTNFAKFKNPTPVPVNDPDGTSITWLPYTENEFNYLLLSSTSQMNVNYRQQDYAFWREYLWYLIHDEDFRDHPFKLET